MRFVIRSGLIGISVLGLVLSGCEFNSTGVKLKVGRLSAAITSPSTIPTPSATAGPSTSLPSTAKLCLQPDTQQWVSGNTSYSYFTLSSGTAAACNAAKVTTTCSPTSGQFSPPIPAVRYASCGLIKQPPVLPQSNPILDPVLILSAYYVSPSGSDSKDGKSAASAFLTLEKAQSAMQGSSIKTTYLMGGTYNRTATLSLSASDAGESWLGYPGQVPVLDGGNSLIKAISVNGNQITIRWLTIQNYAQIGILIQGASGTVIDSNTIKNIQSSGWNEGGIVMFNNISDTKISHNLIQNSQYTGIMYANAPGDTLSNLVIDSNAVYNTCISVKDCGALYADDRNHSAKGVVFSNNIVGNYGTTSTQSKAIYLDDQMSNATVKNNIIYGTGSQAVQYHTGDHNVFQNNIFDISGAGALALYQDDGVYGYGMSGNVFTCNIVYSSAKFPSPLWLYYTTQANPPSVSNNLYWAAGGTFSNSGSVIDKSPKVANPGFTNPGNADYSFTTNPASFCNFAPIDTSKVGPLPNL